MKTNKLNQLETQIRLGCEEGNLPVIAVSVLELSLLTFDPSLINWKAHLFTAATRGNADILAVLLIVSSKYFPIETIANFEDQNCCNLLGILIDGGHVESISVLLRLIYNYPSVSISSTHPAIKVCNHSKIVSLSEVVDTVDVHKTRDFLDALINSTKSKSAFTEKLLGWYRRGYLSSLICTIVLYMSMLVSITLTSGFLVHSIGETATNHVNGGLHFKLSLISLLTQIVISYYIIKITQVDPGYVNADDREDGVYYRLSQDQHSGCFSHSHNYSIALERLANFYGQPGNSNHYGSNSNGISNGTSKGNNRAPILSSSKSFCCHKCQLHRPFRTGHSSFSQRCIYEYDHFCSFLFCDVGRNNYCLFFCLLTCMTILVMPLFEWICLAQLSLSIIDETSILRSLSGKETAAFMLTADVLSSYWKIPKYLSAQSLYLPSTMMVNIVLGMVLWTGMMWFSMLVLFICHLRFVSLGMTTREYLIYCDDCNKSTSQPYSKTMSAGYLSELPYLCQTRSSRESNRKLCLYSRDSVFSNLLERLFPMSLTQLQFVPLNVLRRRDAALSVCEQGKQQQQQQQQLKDVEVSFEGKKRTNAKKTWAWPYVIEVEKFLIPHCEQFSVQEINDYVEHTAVYYDFSTFILTHSALVLEKWTQRLQFALRKSFVSRFVSINKKNSPSGE